MSETSKTFLSSHTIELRVPREKDIQDKWTNWYNNQDKTRFNSHGVFPLSPEEELRIVKKKMKDPTTILLAIYEKNTDRLIGNACLQNINLLYRHCNISLTIGESAPFTAGVETFALLLDHAFMRLNLIRVHDSTHEKLLNFVKMIGVLGFEYEGRAKQYYIQDGERYDAIYFAVLAETYFNLKKKRSGNILYKTEELLIEALREALKNSNL